MDAGQPCCPPTEQSWDTIGRPHFITTMWHAFLLAWLVLHLPLQAVDNGDIEIASARRGTSYIGRGVMLANILAYAARGGQVVLSETAWRSVKDVVMQHPNAVSVLSLGTHVLAADFSRPMHLMEVMPSLLTKRNFAHIHTKRQVEPGYRDAPDTSKPMAMVFMKVGVARRGGTAQWLVAMVLQSRMIRQLTRGQCETGHTAGLMCSRPMRSVQHANGIQRGADVGAGAWLPTSCPRR